MYGSCRLVFVVCSLLALGGPALAAEAPDPDPLSRFEPFLDTTWKAVVDPTTGASDIALWERALAGQAIRIRHSVNDGAYGGETWVMWDRERGELVYFYFTTAGFYTEGTMWFDEEGRLVSREAVVGQQGGVTEVQATQTLLEDGRLLVETRMLRDGAWEARRPVTYAPDPTAEVVLPRRARP